MHAVCSVLVGCIDTVACLLLLNRRSVSRLSAETMRYLQRWSRWRFSTVQDSLSSGMNAMLTSRRYYLSGTDAYRLKLLLPLTPAMLAAHEMQRLAHDQTADQPSPADEPVQHGDQGSAHAPACSCHHHGAAHGASANVHAVHRGVPTHGDAPVANGSQSTSGGEVLKKQKPARKSKSRRH